MSRDRKPSCAVLVPSYRRPQDLARCLAALAAQDRRAEQVVVVVREDDADTRRVIRAADSGVHVTEILVSQVGQVAALNAGLGAVECDIVAVTDDDVAPRIEWLALLTAPFDDPAVVGAGGRDVIVGHPYALCHRVGLVSWQGRVTGNHHRGVGPPRSVDVLKGANMAFRTDWLRRFQFDRRLLGSGAQVHNDLMISLRIRAAGGKLVYDPLILVDHYPAPRPAGDARMVLAFAPIRNEVHNETLALMEFLPAPRQFAYVLWTLLVGSRRRPGLGLALALLPTQRRLVIVAFLATVSGHWLGLSTWWRARHRTLRDDTLPATIRRSSTCR